MTPPVEVTTRYVTSVPDLSGAWAFVMSRIDLVGPRPRVEIRHRSIASIQSMFTDEDLEWTDCFEVVVEGMVEEDPDGGDHRG